MARFDPYSRRELKRLRSAWARRNALLLVLLAAGLVGLITLVTLGLLMTWPSNTAIWYILGLGHAALIAFGLHVAHTMFLATNREAMSQIRGAWGEENTRSELQRARRRRLIWGWVDSINLQVGDLDHLVVTRHGGLVAIDSKWRNHTTAQDNIEMARSARRAGARAEGIARTVLRSERGSRHRAKSNPLIVRPVVVLWGAALHSVPEGAEIDGVCFIPGRQLIAWLRQLEGEQVSQQAARDILKRLEDFRSTAWHDDNARTATKAGGGVTLE